MIVSYYYYYYYFIIIIILIGNYYYNLQNKEAANATGAYYSLALGDACKTKPAKFGCSGSDFAMTIATAQLAIGTIWGIFLWLYPEGRPQPKITIDDFIKMIPSGVCSAGAHAASVFSLAAGGVALVKLLKLLNQLSQQLLVL